ncbi:MAG: hypothetical protein NTZ35_08230 [Ignavibacteriales bacterium]|nr:hypothetical protein [Ignavibacteriales bacterium]
MNCTPLRQLVSLMLAFLLIQCAPDDPRRPKPQAYHHLDSLNTLLVRELSKSRVVMFGDSYPGHITNSRCVTSLLEYWLNRLQQNPSDTSLPHKLALALELGQQGEMILNDFLKTGDRYPLMRFLIDEQAKFGSDAYLTKQLSVDYLQFCDRLRVIKTTIDSLIRLNPSLTLSLEILGPESDPPYGYQDVRSKPRQHLYAMKSQWDAAVRDRETSSRLMRYLAQHPNHKVLVFTRGTHMWRDSNDGYFLARDLDSLLGRSNVSVFQTSRLRRNPVSGPQIEEYRHDKATADFLVRKPLNPPYLFPFFLVKSQNTFRALVDLAEKYSASPDTLEIDLSRKMLSHALESLRRSSLALDPIRNHQIASLQAAVDAATRRAIMAPQTFSDIRRLISGFDAVKDVLEIDSVMTTFTPSSDYYNTLTTMLDNLPGGGSSASDTVSRVTTEYKSVDTITAAWARTWKERKSERRAYMLLQILWLGTPNEVASAMNALRRETGHDFAAPSQWDDWWQSRR